MRKIEPKTIHRHFKGKYYLIEDIAQNTNNQELMVVYRELYGSNRLWVRALSDFLETVDPDRKDNITGQSYRFVEVKSII